jgi:hypothetical protein
MSGNTFYTTTLNVPCPKCGKISRKLLRELVVNSLALCSHCPTAIDISSPEWRAKIDDAVEDAKRRSLSSADGG